MRTKILCCRTLEPELRLVMEKCGCDYPLEVLAENDHDVPGRLRDNIQKKLDAVSGFDRVLLAFTFCGGAAAGLRAGDFQLVIPKADDCLTLLMGSREKRRAATADGNGLFVTKGWLEHEKSIPAELRRLREKYPEPRAKRIIRGLYGHFDSLNVIDTGAYDVKEILKRTEALAEELGLRHRVVQGDPQLLEQLLQEHHDPGHFVTVPPGGTVEEAEFLAVFN